MYLRSFVFALAIAFAAALSPKDVEAQALSSSFTYQGELKALGLPANGNFDMELRLFNAVSGGAQLGTTQSVVGVTVSNGLFTLLLDFGAAQFAGERQWLEIRIKPAGSGSFETLSPRTEITAAPYAWAAANALGNSVTGISVVNGSLSGSDIADGGVSAINLAENSVSGPKIADGSITGNDLALESIGSTRIADGSVQGVDLADGSVSSAKIADDSISGTDLAPGSIGSTRIADGNVQGVDLADGSVSSAKIADGSIFGIDLAPDSVGTTRIADGNVFLSDLGANSVNGSKIVDGTVGLVDVDTTQVQARVSGTCAAGSSISAIAADGTVTCESDDASAPGWSLTGNTGTNSSTHFIGTTDNQPLVLRVNNAQALRIEQGTSSPNLIGGFNGNTVTAGVSGTTIGGGGLNSLPNRITDNGGTVSGGAGNQAGDGLGTTGDETFATVGGGSQNIAREGGSTVGGGGSNTVNGGFGTVGGGVGNTAGRGFSTVGGGTGNVASGASSVVGGGSSNTASGEWSTVGGGTLNCAGGSASWAGGTQARVRPGSESGASGSGCVGVASTGFEGDAGTFVWADSQNTSFTSTGANQFLVRAAGGMAINTNTPSVGAALTVNGNVSVANAGSLSFGSQTRQMLSLWGPDQYGIGVQTSRLYYRTSIGGGFNWFEGGVHSDAADNAGTGGTLRMRLSNTGQLQTTTGTISTLSDARLKEGVHDYVGALDKINALRPVHYTYIDGGRADFQPAGEQLGFIAQDMQQVFPQWVDQDVDGHLMLSMRGFEAVAVRGIQELSAENAQLRQQLAELSARLDALER